MYVQSSPVKKAIGDGGSNALLQFLRNNVFPHEDHFAGHLYHNTFAFEEYSNTCLEGTNNGLKYSGDAVRPSMGVAQAGKCMINQDERKSNTRKRKAVTEFNSTPLYTGTATGKKINKVAENMLKKQIELSENYCSVRISETKWALWFSGKRKEGEEEMDIDHEWPTPRFRRTRFVSIHKDGGLQCSCGYANRNGIPDRHIIHVAMNYGRDFEGFTHHQVHIRFWCAYDRFVAEGDSKGMTSLETKIRNSLKHARLLPTLIMTVAGGFREFKFKTEFYIGKHSVDEFTGMDANAAFSHWEDSVTENNKDLDIMNYPEETIDRAMDEEEEAYRSGRRNYAGLSQEIHTYEDDDSIEEEGVGDFDEHNERSFSMWQSTRSMVDMNSHQILYPRLKELASLYENNQERLREIAIVLDEWIKKGKAENTRMQQIPTGQMISAMGRNKYVKQTKHQKQNRDK